MSLWKIQLYIKIRNFHTNGLNFRFPADIPSTGFFSLPELHVHQQACTPFVRGTLRHYSRGQHVETLFMNGSVLVRVDIPLFMGDNSVQRFRNQIKNLICRTVGGTTYQNTVIRSRILVGTSGKWCMTIKELLKGC